MVSSVTKKSVSALRVNGKHPNEGHFSWVCSQIPGRKEDPFHWTAAYLPLVTEAKVFMPCHLLETWGGFSIREYQLEYPRASASEYIEA